MFWKRDDVVNKGQVKLCFEDIQFHHKNIIFSFFDNN